MTSYVGEIRMFAGSVAPDGWALCQGQSLPIEDYEPLFNLIMTTYGGDGEERFNLPNLAGRAPIHQGTGTDGIPYQLGQVLGSETVTLSTQQMRIHGHAVFGSTAPATGANPTGLVFATGAVTSYMIEAQDPDTYLNSQAIAPVGGGQPHDNMQPFTCINYIISLSGIYPSPK